MKNVYRINLTGRAWEQAHFAKMLAREHGDIWLIEGPGGIGKSALMTHFASMCIASRRPYIRLDATHGIAAEGEAVLKQLCQGGVGLERLRSLSEGEIWTWLEAGEATVGHVSRVWESVKDAILAQLQPEEQGQVGLIPQLLKVIAGVVFGERTRQAQLLRSALKTQPETTLLGGMAREGRLNPVLFIDTYENLLIGDVTIRSRLDIGLGLGGQVSSMLQAQPEPAERFLAALIRVLLGRGWLVVVAGRQLSTLKYQHTERLHSLQGLGVNIIADDWLRPMWKRRGHLRVEAELTTSIAKQLFTASFGGNPLWLNALCTVVDTLLSEGKSPQDLIIKTVLDIGMNSSPFGGGISQADAVRCKADILAVLFRGEKLDMASAWRLALPERIDRKRLKALFPNEVDGDRLVKRLIEIGLIAGNRAGTVIRLHEEVRELLLWWAEIHGHLALPETRACFNELLAVLCQERPDLAELPRIFKIRPSAARIEEFYQSNAEDTDISWYREGIRYAILSSEQLAKRYSPAEHFALCSAVTESIYLNFAQKWVLAANMKDISDADLSEFISNLAEAQNFLMRTIGGRLATQLIEDLGKGLLKELWDIAWWTRFIDGEGHSPAAYFGLFVALNQQIVWAQLRGAKLVACEAVGRVLRHRREMLTRASSAARNQDYDLAKAMLSSAYVVYGNSDYNHTDLFDDTIDRFSSATELQIQELIAEALIQRALRLFELGSPELALDAFDEIQDRLKYRPQPSLQVLAAAALGEKAGILTKLRRESLAVATFDELIGRCSANSNLEVKEVLVIALTSKAKALVQLHRPNQASEVLDELLNSPIANAELSFKVERAFAEALLFRAELLTNLGQVQAAICAYDDFLKRFGASVVPEVDELVATAVFRKALALEQVGSSDQAISAFGELLERFSFSRKSRHRNLVASSFVRRAALLRATQRAGDAIVLCDQFLDNYGESQDEGLQEHIARALFNKAAGLLELGQIEQSIGVADELLKRFDGTTSPELKEGVARTLILKFRILMEKELTLDADAVFQELVDKFEFSPEESVKKLIANALNGRAFRLIISGKAMSPTEDPSDTWKRAQAMLKKAQALSADRDGIIAGNLAYVTLLLGDKESGHDLMMIALAAGGEQLYRYTIEDLALQRIPADHDIRILLEDCWRQQQGKF